jgi:hypothetical protein
MKEQLRLVWSAVRAALQLAVSFALSRSAVDSDLCVYL